MGPMHTKLSEREVRDALYDFELIPLNKFIKYYFDNPSVWTLFKKYSEAALFAGRKRYSHVTIMELIRWNCEIEQGDAEFKVNNNNKALYARLLMRTDPRFNKFFEIRECKITKSATNFNYNKKGQASFL